MYQSILLAALLTAAPAASDQWSQFRGGELNGHSQATGLPLAWSEQQNIVWKTVIHDRGWSSPVVWDDQVWVTTATEDGHQMFAICLDRATGRIVYDKKVFDNEKVDHISVLNSYASPTPAIEAGRVYVHFGTYGTACLDTASGEILWTRRDLNCDHHEGPGSSPMLLGDLLVFHADGRDAQYVVALDKRTGKTVWKTNRSVDYSPFTTNQRKSFCTPTPITLDGKTQLVSPGAKAIMGYDLQTGEELWKIPTKGWSVVPRPLFGHGLVFVVTDYERPELWAVRPDGRGELPETHIAWSIRKGMPATPSLLLVDDLLYMVTDRGVGLCVEAKTGQIVWKERIGGNYLASPIYADGRLYFVNQEATTTVLSPGREYKVLSVNRLDGELKASPAVAGRALFLRTKTHLYRIEQKPN